MEDVNAYYQVIHLFVCTYIKQKKLDSLTSSLLLHLQRALGGPAHALLLLLLLAAAVEVLHHHAHEHVQHEEPHQQDECDEVQQPPLGVVYYWLRG